MTNRPLLVHDPILGREIRGGSYADQGVSTYAKTVEAIGDGRHDDAASLACYFLVEARVCYDVFGGWRARLVEYLAARGLDRARLQEVDDRLGELLRLPDGRAFVREEQWEEFGAALDDLVAAIPSDPPSRSIDRLDELFETWRRAHDRDVDWICGLLDEVVSRFGEESIAPMYDHMLSSWFADRYRRFDVDLHPWSDALHLNVLVALESMRAHLCGPSRRGDVEVEELGDRIVLSFDPCGTGGRSIQGDAVEGTGPRMEPPYGWPVTEEPAAWNHFEPGVCVYCAHCIVLTEQMPIDAFGYPVRVVDPPRYDAGTATGDGKCRWTMFKDPAAVPVIYYTRVGRAKPAEIGSAAIRAARAKVEVDDSTE